jgi:PAS domain-containing protein
MGPPAQGSVPGGSMLLVTLDRRTGLSTHVRTEQGSPTEAHGSSLELFDARVLLEAMPECLVVAASDGRIMYANHRLEELSGFGREELLGRPVVDLVSMD